MQNLSSTPLYASPTPSCERLIDRILLRVAKIIAWSLYRFKVSGKEAIPPTGRAILACNHVSFIDAVLIMAASSRPVRFVMDYRIFANPFIGWFFRLCRAIPIAPKHEQPTLYEAAFDACAQTLERGELLAIFPEGAITRNGQLQSFKSGLLKIVRRTPSPVIPMGLRNMWGSFFSRIEGQAMVRPFRRGWRNHVTLHIAPAMSLEDMQVLQAQILHLSQSHLRGE